MTSEEQTPNDGSARSEGSGYRSDRRSGSRRPYRPRDDRGYGDRPRRDGYSGRGRSDEGRRQYSDGGPRRYRDGPRDERPRRSYGERPERSPEEGSEGRREYRPRYDRDSGDRPSRGRSDDRGYGRQRGERRDGRGYRPRDGGYRRDDRGFRGERRFRDDREQERPKVSVPADTDVLLRKAADCEENGRSDLAYILYLHGASRLSIGCENGIVRMIRAAGVDQFPSIRGRLKKECPEEILPVFDYLCSTVDSGYDVSGIRESALSGNPYAIHCLIRMGAVEKDDDLVDLYGKCFNDHPQMVKEGLQMLQKRTGSEKAKMYLDQRADFLRGKEQVRVFFKRALKGDESAVADLERLSAEHPEAVFLRGYLTAFADGKGEDYVKERFTDNTTTVLSYLQELSLPRSPYSKYLAAKKLQSKGETWIPSMVEAVKAGSEEAFAEISEIKDRSVRGPLQAYYFAKGDIESLALAYDGKDSKMLDKYCNKEPSKILEVGRILGGTKEVHWLVKCYHDGCTECREALVEISKDYGRYGKPLVYALHDTGADIDAARVYFDMEGDPSLPSVKWLAKVCRNEEAKEYVRSVFEKRGDLETFDDLFVDDGYVYGGPRSDEGRSRDRDRY